jgi:hypothetical protein
MSELIGAAATVPLCIVVHGLLWQMVALQDQAATAIWLGTSAML